tara:strand:- start:24075 stop:24536 length:462 start_codon:yes stop_codon:yes gene_type:complete
MIKRFITPFALCLAAAPLFADGHAAGDAEAGASVFKKCKSCHAITDADGTDIEKGGRTGPNLYGIYTRVAGADPEFRYGPSLVQAGEAGLVWDEATFVEYVADPKGFLAKFLDDKKAKSKMSFKLKKPDDAANVWAYLVSVGPEVAVAPAASE